MVITFLSQQPCKLKHGTRRGLPGRYILTYLGVEREIYQVVIFRNKCFKLHHLILLHQVRVTYLLLAVAGLAWSVPGHTFTYHCLHMSLHAAVCMPVKKPSHRPSPFNREIHHNRTSSISSRAIPTRTHAHK